jgi:hypothetical protein
MKIAPSDRELRFARDEPDCSRDEMRDERRIAKPWDQ